jgi:hypothetical protein
MKNGEFALAIGALLVAVACVFGAIGSQMGRDQMYDRCFEHFNYLTVLDARANCNNILKAK